MDRNRDRALFGIGQLLAQYAHAIDDRDWDNLGSLFSPDGVFDASAGGAVKAYRGPAQVAAGFRAREALQPISHHSTNELILIEECCDKANVHSKWLAHLGEAGIAAGDYRDVVILIGGSWRFRERTVQFRFQPKGWPRPA